MTMTRPAPKIALLAIALCAVFALLPMPVAAADWNLAVTTPAANNDDPTGDYETRSEQILAAPTHDGQQYVDPVYETRYDGNGDSYEVCISDGYWRDVYVPDVDETQDVNILPDYGQPIPVFNAYARHDRDDYDWKHNDNRDRNGHDGRQYTGGRNGTHNDAVGKIARPSEPVHIPAAGLAPSHSAAPAHTVAHPAAPAYTVHAAQRVSAPVRPAPPAIQSVNAARAPTNKHA